MLTIDFILILVVSSQVYCTDDIEVNKKDCPALSIPTDLGCKCGLTFVEKSSQQLILKQFIRCQLTNNITTISISSTISMSYNETTGISLGVCPYNSCKRRASIQCTGRGLKFVKVPKDRLQINDVMCGGINRTGLLCSMCVDGLGPAVYYYGMPCVKCLGHLHGWLLYATLIIIFPTLFFIFLATLHIHVSSCALDSVVLMCQIIVTYADWGPGFFNVAKPKYSLYIVFLTIYGIWNLDFFRHYIPPFCIDEGMSALFIVSLEYVVAIYPLFLTALTYVLIELHGRGCRPLVLMWRPFHRCFARFRRQWNPKGTIIHAFASFFLLSYVKIAAVSFTLLSFTELYDEKFKVSRRVPYVDPSVPPFSAPHTPYVVLGICSLLLFTLLPLLVLALYSLKFTQKCLNSLHIKANFIEEVICSLQGCYKDGTGNNGSRDLRCFAAVFLCLRLICTSTYAVVSPSINYSIVVVAMIFSLALIVAHMKPYKERWCNIWSSVILMAIGTGMITTVFSHVRDIS